MRAMSATFAARLLAWYDRARRDLPWRRTTDPWAIWVSEVMLQQTRVEAVRRAWERFVARFPTPASFADVSDDVLNEAWRGLGYYRRAHLLRDGARAVAQHHGGRVPDDPRALAGLPGVGDYTRGAIASIAFGRCEPAIDGNVERVVARHRAIDEPVDRGDARARVRAFVLRQQDPRRPGDFNQALMELGATACTPRAPRCAECPVRDDCLARARGAQLELPRARPKPAMLAVCTRVVLASEDCDVLAHRIPPDEVNAGQLELPGPGILQETPTAADLARVLTQRFGLALVPGRAVATIRHAITNHSITLVAHRAAMPRELPAGLVRAAAGDPRVPWSTPTRKVFRRAFS
jgi:A/G-specific adenine glycosylase